MTSDDITRRDIIEYAYTRLMAYALDQAAVKLLSFDFSQGDIQKLREEIADVVLDVDTTPDGLQFTPTQQAAFENALNLLIDDLVDFRGNLPVENEDQWVRQHLGTRFEQFPPSSYTFDTKTELLHDIKTTSI